MPQVLTSGWSRTSSSRLRTWGARRASHRMKPPRRWLGRLQSQGMQRLLHTLAAWAEDDAARQELHTVSALALQRISTASGII